MPIVQINDTGVLAPAITDLSQSLSYVDIAVFNSRVPDGFGGFIIVNPNLDTLATMSINSIEDLYDVYLSTSLDTIFSSVRFSTTIALVMFSFVSGEYSEFPTTIITKEIFIEKTAQWAVITPDPNTIYTEPTEFTITPPIGYNYAIVLNNAFYFSMFPYSQSALMFDKGLMLTNPITLTLFKNTRINIFYYESLVNPYNTTINSKSDEFELLINEPFNFTIIDYGKISSFSETINTCIRSTKPCSIELKIIDLELCQSNTTVIEITDTLEFNFSIASSCIVELKSILPKELIRKYIFKREINSKSVYSFYTDTDNKLNNNILDSSLFSLTQPGGEVPY